MADSDAGAVDRHLGVWCCCVLLNCRHDEDDGDTAAGDFNRSMGALLRATRMAYGLSLADAQELSGGWLKGATLCSWERGVRAVDPEQLAALAAFYRVPVVALIPGRSGGPAGGQQAVSVIPRLRGAKSD